MIEAASAGSDGANAALTALLTVFAALAVAVALLFVTAGALIARHARQRKRLEGQDLTAEAVSTLTTGDLTVDPQLAVRVREWSSEQPPPASAWE